MVIAFDEYEDDNDDPEPEESAFEENDGHEAGGEKGRKKSLLMRYRKGEAVNER